ASSSEPLGARGAGGGAQAASPRACARCSGADPCSCAPQSNASSRLLSSACWGLASSRPARERSRRPAGSRRPRVRAPRRRPSRMSATGWRLLLGLNLGHPIPRAIVEEARAAAAILGRSLAGVAIGNEPDLFTRPAASPFRLLLGSAALRPPEWGLSAYEAEI